MRRMISAMTAIAVSCAGVPMRIGAEKLGEDVYAVSMDGLERDQHDIELYKQSLKVCGETRGFRIIKDNVDTHFGTLRGYIVIRCLDERQIIEPRREDGI